MAPQPRPRPGQKPTPPKEAEGRRAPSLVPRASLAGNALIVIIAIMSFLASLTAGAVGVVRDAAGNWQNQVLREVTIQIVPMDGHDMNSTIRKAVDIARSTPGIASAVPYTDADTTKLLEPWLGKNIALDELPVPRLIVVRVAEGKTPDLGGLSKRLTLDVPGASLDDHRAWLDRLKITGDALSGFGLAILALVLFATALSVLFATRSAVSGNRDVVEVLHVVGARDGYIARAFGRRFFGLGLRGGLIGGVLATVLFAVADWAGGSAGDPGNEVLLGRLDMSLTGYAGILAVTLFIAGLTTITSRLTVMAHLRRLD
jgi:cell division transport system permease protein